MTTVSPHHPLGTGIPVGPGLDLRVPAASTTASISVHEGTLAPGDTIPAHFHDSADQMLYIIDGQVEVTVGDLTFSAKGGDLVSKPHGVKHGFANRSDLPARVLEITSDDSFERFTLAATEVTDPAEFRALQARHGVHFPEA